MSRVKTISQQQALGSSDCPVEAPGRIRSLHGPRARKLFGAFGGAGLAETVNTMGPLGYAVAIGEFFGGLGLIVGFLSRIARPGSYSVGRFLPLPKSGVTDRPIVILE